MYINNAITDKRLKNRDQIFLYSSEFSWPVAHQFDLISIIVSGCAKSGKLECFESLTGFQQEASLERAILDHYATFLTLDKIKPKKPIRKLIKTRNFRKLNPVLFYNDCALLPLKQTATDPNLSINERTEKMDKLIINVVDKHIPEKNYEGTQ